MNLLGTEARLLPSQRKMKPISLLICEGNLLSYMMTVFWDPDLLLMMEETSYKSNREDKWKRHKELRVHCEIVTEKKPHG